MKEIKIAILDFWPNDGHFQLCNNVFINTISDVYYVKIDKENPDIIFYSLFGIEHRKEQYKHVPKVLFIYLYIIYIRYSINEYIIT